MKNRNEKFMFYPKSSSDSLDIKLFENPTKEYRGAPFWSWNCRLDKQLLKEQIEFFKKMGLGGFHIHSRVGLDTEYLGQEFMDCVKFCTEIAKEKDMFCYLYDEDKAPSGFAGGLATKKIQNRQRKLLFTSKTYESVSLEEAKEKGLPHLLCCYDIILDKDGNMVSYKTISESDGAKGEKRYAYLITDSPSVWYNNQTYLDTLSKDAVQDFIDITYNKFKDCVGNSFSNTIPSIFTDEPAYCTCKPLNATKENDNGILAWTIEFQKLFKEQKGFDILEKIPELFYESADGIYSKARYDYYDFSAELFSQTYLGSIHDWCEKNNIMLTGHLKSEHSLYEQTIWCGETMRAYKYFQFPGMDILLDKIEFSTAKQCQSAAHQYGICGMSSEMYGVTNWDFDFRDHKFQGDWQAALGVTLRVHHLSMLSMSGEGKRDFPASINYQSPWYNKYSYIENHYARLATALTRGTPCVDVAVIHPVETMWLYLGSNEKTKDTRNKFEQDFEKLCSTLLCSLIDFDFISESLLPSQFVESDSGFNVGFMSYKTVIVPNMQTIRSTTLNALKKFVNNGGKVLFIGNAPCYVDGVKSEVAEDFFKKCRQIPADQNSLIDNLKQERVIDIIDKNGNRTNNFIYNLRDDNNSKWLFIANAVKPDCKENIIIKDVTIIIKGHFTPVIYDTLSGKSSYCDFEFCDDYTKIPHSFYLHDSLLLKLEKTHDKIIQTNITNNVWIPLDSISECKISRTEPNVLLLDKAEYSFNGKDFNPLEEILRIDDKVRVLSGLKSRELLTFVQPWLLPDEKPENHVTLKMKIDAKDKITDTYLALEDAEFAKIILNGNLIPTEIDGFYVDRFIKKIKLGNLNYGTNILEITLPVHNKSNIESCYLLGEFDVEYENFKITLCKKKDNYTFGDVSCQGMLFYGGNIQYQYSFETETDGNIRIDIGNYNGATVGVKLDGSDKGIVAFSPYVITLENVEKGTHSLTLTLYGNRYNTFGPLHNAAKSKFASPYSWRKQGNDFSYDYVNLRPFGITNKIKISISKTQKSQL